MTLWIVAGTLMLAGFLTAGRGLGRMVFGLRVVSGGGRVLTGGALAAFGAVAGLIGINLQTYHALTAEEPVATIVISSVGEDRYEIALTEAEGEETTAYTVEGDEWRLEARVLRFHPWATVVGVGPVYRLERLSGRWADPKTAAETLPSIHALCDKQGIELAELARHPLAKSAQAIDVEFGNGVFMPMAHGARYEISIGPGGLVPRPLNDEAREAVESW